MPGWKSGAGRQATTSFRDPKARYGGGIPYGDPSGYDWGLWVAVVAVDNQC